MTSSVGQQVPRALVSHLASELTGLIQGLPIGGQFEVPPSSDICYSLELFIPGVLRQRYPEWEKESLDGIFVTRATVTKPATAELVGTCILISDQAVTPFLCELEILPSADSVKAVRVMLGEPGGGPLGISGPTFNSRAAKRLLMSVIERLDDIPWSYVVLS